MGVFHFTQGGCFTSRGLDQPRMAPRHKKQTKRKWPFFFFSKHVPRKRKEAGTMPSATMGVASPWFTGGGSDLLVVK